jgi:hypothetical protein
MIRGGRCRGWAVLWAVLQLALPTVATFADGRLERQSIGGPGAHVESSSTVGCRPAHAAECALCQSVSHLAVGAQRSSCPAAACVARGEPGAPRPWRSTVVVARLSLPRAPPGA